MLGLPGRSRAARLERAPQMPIALNRRSWAAMAATSCLLAALPLLAATPNAEQRARGMRRLGDLEMDHTDAQLALGDGNTAAGYPDYRQAISQYSAYLKHSSRNDEKIYGEYKCFVELSF